MNQRVWHFPRMAPHPAGSDAGEALSPCVWLLELLKETGEAGLAPAQHPSAGTSSPVQLSPKNHGGAAVPWLTPPAPLPHQTPCWGTGVGEGV